MATTTPRLPGEQGARPTQIPPRGWWQMVRRAFKEASADNVAMLAGGVAFFAFLAIPPALIARSRSTAWSPILHRWRSRWRRWRGRCPSRRRR